MKKLPDVKMGHLEGKNLTFSSDSEEPVNNPNFVRAIIYNFIPNFVFFSLGKLITHDKRRWDYQ